MCGIVGFWQSRKLNAPADKIVQTMAQAVRHRGPDGCGTWNDPYLGLALGHRRLAIIDLSEAGHQPMVSANDRYVLCYNGEIYNHRDIRRDLDQSGANILWRGNSDTEVLLEALAYWGIEGGLKRANGMFAFALWDKKKRKLYLARDRIGEKPLYYGVNNGTFLFGSELKALQKFPGWTGQIDRNALASYLRYNYIPAPQSIWCGIKKLEPGHFICIEEGGSKVTRPCAYWNFFEVAKAASKPFDATDQELIDQLEALLLDSVSLRMEADVPLGAFLSGGVDSSAIVALMQAQSSKPVKTFSIGYNEASHNEAHHAKAVAMHLGTDHTELYLSPKQSLDIIPALPNMWDEPFSDSSQIPTFLVSQMTSEHVTVALSGDGGDELFGGYNRYHRGMKLWSRSQKIPIYLQNILAKIIKSPFSLASLEFFSGILPYNLRASQISDKARKFADLLQLSKPDQMYERLISHWNDPSAIVIGGMEQSRISDIRCPVFEDFRQTMMFLDTVTYLPDDILTKVDRASMAVSLEARVPFLDYRVAEFAWRLPMSSKIRGNEGKWILKQVLDRYVPRKLMERPKMGFGVPIEHWLRGPLRDWAEELLSEQRLTEEGFFNPAPIRQKWREHKEGKWPWHYHLWDILMFQAWHERIQK